MSAIRSIDTAARVYAVASRASVSWIVADHPMLADFSAAFRTLTRSLDDQKQDPLWSELLSALRLMRWCLSSFPLQFSHEALGIGQMTKSIEESLSEVVASYPRSVDQLTRIVELANSLAVSADDPLGDVAREALREANGTRNALLLPNSRHQRAVQMAFERFAPWLDVVTAGELSERDPYGLIVATGTTHSYRRNPFVFLAPRAQQVKFIRWNWVNDEFPGPGLLEGGRRSIQSARYATSPRTHGLVEADQVAPALDWNAIGSRMGVHRDSFRQADVLESWVFILAGGYAVPLAVGGQALTIEPEAEESDRLRTDVAVDDLESGDYILLREAGSGDFLIDVADRLMGAEGRSLRAKQLEWKAALRKRISEEGLEGVSASLKSRGARHAHPWNVRYWSGTRALKPEDFMLLMTYLDLGTQAQDFADAMDQLIRYHIKAGHRIRKMILDGIGQADLTPLVMHGTMSFELEGADGGTLTAYRIESRSEQTWQAPIGRLGRAVEVGQLWPD